MNALGHDEAFEPVEARRLARKLAFHYTPKHTCRARQRRDASWLNMAEIEFSVIMRKLGPRVPDEKSLNRKVIGIETSRNHSHSSVDWQFTTDDARIKLRRLYPAISD